MPCISRFYGISIYLYYSDHAPPHVHARYAGAKASVDIGTGAVLDGRLPPRALRLVREWLARRKSLVRASWNQARTGLAPSSVPPLDGGSPVRYLPEVTRARVVGPTSLLLTFDDGTRKRVNVGHLLRGPVFIPLRRPAFFRKARASRAAGTVVWPNGADIAPETLYDLPEEAVRQERKPKARSRARRPRRR